MWFLSMALMLSIFFSYPAGFVYIFSVLFYLTSHGTNIKLAQYIFATLYLTFLVTVFYLNHKSKIVSCHSL